MNREVLLSSAYFPPSVFFSLCATSDMVTTEKWENYHKQTYRNRCTIAGANGPISLSVPVLRGSQHKTAIRDIEIDNTRSWRKQHMRSIISAYGTAPFFMFYSDIVESVINYKCDSLLEFNLNGIEIISSTIGITTQFRFSESFAAIENSPGDYRYRISPKEKELISGYSERPYTQVFSDRFGFIKGLSILDMLFNNGPGTHALLLESLV